MISPSTAIISFLSVTLGTLNCVQLLSETVLNVFKTVADVLI